MRIWYDAGPIAPEITFTFGTTGQHTYSNRTLTVSYPSGTVAGDMVCLTLHAPENLTSYISSLDGFSLVTFAAFNAGHSIYTKVVGSESSAAITFNADLPVNPRYSIFTAHKATNVGFATTVDTAYYSPGTINTPSATGTAGSTYSAATIVSYYYYDITNTFVPSGYTTLLDWHPGVGSGTYGIGCKVNTAQTEDPSTIYVSTSATHEYVSTTLVFSIVAPAASLAVTADGSLSFQGTADSFKGQSIAAAGSLNFSGQAASYYGEINQSAGSLLLSGAASASAGRSYQADGQLVLSGVATTNIGKAQAASGELLFSGTSSVIHGGSQSQTNNSSGSLLFTGSGTKYTGVTQQAAGSLLLSGAGNFSKGGVIATAGNLVLSGAASGYGIPAGAASDDNNWRSRGYGK